MRTHKAKQTRGQDKSASTNHAPSAPTRHTLDRISITRPDDAQERQADRIAAQVMHGASSVTSTVPQPARTAPVHMPPMMREVLQSSGQPLDTRTRTFMESRFHHDFGQVRVHTDARAATSAGAIGAAAYTAGQHVVFGKRARPGANALTAHELAHVVQHGRTPHSDALIVQRQCEGNVGTPDAYAHGAASHLQCNAQNTGISDDAEVTRRITAGRRRARVMVGDTLTVLERMVAGTAADTAQDRFQHLFGLSSHPTPGQIRQAMEIYRRICAWLISDSSQQGGGILCLTQGTGQCRGPVLASAACATGEVIRRPIQLCPDGISTDSSRTAQTLIHEVAHRFGVCGPPNSVERYESQPQFPSPQAIRTSADSYSAFAREAHQLMGDERLRESSNGLEERPIPSP